MGFTDNDNPIWSALAEPLSSFVGGGNNHDDSREQEKARAGQEEAYRKRYRKRLQSLQTEVEEVNEEATRTRKQLWEAQDNLKTAENQIRQLENHLNEVLELREKDLETVNALRSANSDCVEMENRAREAMEVFKKCYKRAQLKIKENEEEIAVLKERRERQGRVQPSDDGADTSHMVNEAALEYIKTVSDDKEKRLKEMLFRTENEVDLWKSKYKVASKRCENWQEQIHAIEYPTEAVKHMEKQRIAIEQLEEQLRSSDVTREGRDDSFFSYPRDSIDNVVSRAFCDEDIRGGLTEVLLSRIQHLNCALPPMPKM